MKAKASNEPARKAKLTAKLVNSLEGKEKGYRVWDTEIQGYFVFVFPTGTKSYRLRYSVDGRRLEYVLGKHGKLTPDTARDIARQKAPEAARGVDLQQVKKKAKEKAAASKYQTLTGFIDNKYKPWVLAERKYGQGNLDILKRYFSHLYSRPLDKITPWDVQKWRTDKLKSGLKPATLNRATSTLKALLSKAVEWGVINANPLASLKPLKLDNKGKIRYLSEAEEKRLRAALEAREAEHRVERKRYNQWREVRGYEPYPSFDDVTYTDFLKPLVILDINTGMRRGELFSLTWENVDLKRRTLTIEGEEAKSGKTRHIPLNDEAFAVLVAWRNQTDSKGLVFPSPKTGERLDNIKRSWGTLVKDAKLENFRFHDLRHSFASKLVMAGVDLNTVRELLGHGSIEMTLRYAHLAPEHKAAAVALLNQI